MKELLAMDSNSNGKASRLDVLKWTRTPSSVWTTS